MNRITRRQILATTGGATTVFGVGIGLGAAPVSGTTSTQTVTIDGRDGGRTFDGIGAVSAGASSRLLYDYPKPERSDILDYLFKPGYGASLQILKVEIGGDTNSTAGSEPSHMRAPDEVDYDRGYEWWLMKEATKRNPEIELAGLEWGAPGWFDSGFWSQDNIDYLLAWLDGAEQHGLDIDYMGGWNERGYDKSWYVDLATVLDAKYPDTKVIAADSFSWEIAADMENDPAFREAVDIIGMHFVCGHRTKYQDCLSTDTARALGTPLWMSENSAMGYNAGAGPIARGMNRMYIDAKVTSYLSWSPLSAWYANLPIANTGLMLAEWPWSGYYDVGKSIWVTAHTTQFTDPGWNYIDTASGYLDSGASYVSLKAPDGAAFSTIVETMDATNSTTVRFRITGGLPTDVVHLWATDLRSDDDQDHFVHAPAIEPENGEFTVLLQPNHVYTLSTTTGQGTGDAQPDATIHEEMSVPYREDFEGLETSDLAPYFSDINGTFAAEPCAGDREGMCYRQQTTQQPIQWIDTGEMDPTTIFGDPRWWGNYRVSTSFLLEQSGYVELLGRVSYQAKFQQSVGGYHLRVSSDGGWELYSEDYFQGKHVLASGQADVGVGEWHTMALKMRGSHVSVSIDDDTVATVEDTRQTTGNIGLRVSAWQNAQFDDVKIVPAGSRPRFVPQDQMNATATSVREFSGSSTYEAAKAVDDRPESGWHSDPDASFPQAITVDLGDVYTTHGMTVQPPYGTSLDGMIKRYNVSTSRDGTNFENIDSGVWPISNSTKIVKWSKQRARYVRLEATESEGCPPLAAVAEINVATTPLQHMEATATDSTSDFDSDSEFVPQPQMIATATSWSAGYEPRKVIDDNCATFWHSQFNPDRPLPQSITLDLGDRYEVTALTYRPRQDGNSNGIATRYTISVSSDGEIFTEVASGSWQLNPITKTATLPTSHHARYVRLQVVEGGGGFASAAEINIAHTGQ